MDTGASHYVCTDIMDSIKSKVYLASKHHKDSGHQLTSGMILVSAKRGGMKAVARHLRKDCGGGGMRTRRTAR